MVNHPNRRPAIYATRDADDGKISRVATIQKFATIEAAREWLLSPYDASEWDVSSAVIEPGGYGDCWMKWAKAPRVGNPGSGDGYAPFTYRQLSVQAPGEHPGGRFWWITPLVDVLVVSEIREVEEA